MPCGPGTSAITTMRALWARRPPLALATRHSTGIFATSTTYSIANVTDGTSNTIAFAEWLVGDEQPQSAHPLPRQPHSKLNHGRQYSQLRDQCRVLRRQYQRRQCDRGSPDLQHEFRGRKLRRKLRSRQGLFLDMWLTGNLARQHHRAPDLDSVQMVSLPVWLRRLRRRLRPVHQCL